MPGCCEKKSCTLDAMRASHGRVLKIGGVVLAGIAVIYSQSRWPDIIVGGIIAILFLKSATHVLQQSIASLRSQSN